MCVKKFNETSPIASSASHEITIIKPDTIRTIIIDCEQKAMASVLMQIAYAINQVLNHHAAACDVIMRLQEKNCYTTMFSRFFSVDIMRTMTRYTLSTTMSAKDKQEV